MLNTFIRSWENKHEQDVFPYLENLTDCQGAQHINRTYIKVMCYHQIKGMISSVWLDSTTDSMDMNLSRLQKIMTGKPGML